ncbi:MAG TPA: hypothetical protein VM432_10240, partial [Bdellovibrionales bacterium]|nr:hypothetical protein [Bdellovibrionales bacterium]
RLILLLCLTTASATAGAMDLALSQLIPGQAVFSSIKVREKVESRIRAGIEPIQVIKTVQGYVVVDGNHDVLIAMHLGLASIPAEVIDDYSALSISEAWQALKAHELVYLEKSPDELAIHPPSFSSLKDDSNLYLASLIALKVKPTTSGAIATPLDSPNAVWLKDENTPLAIEIEIARVLSAAGIHYDDQWGQNIPGAIVEKARNALLKAQARGVLPRLDQIRLIPGPTRSCRTTILS